MKDLLNLKYRKSHLLFLKTYKVSQNIQQIQRKTFDNLVLRSYQSTTVRYNEYEALRRILSRKLTKLLRFSILKKPYILVTAKPKEIRMGKGKGSFSHFHFPSTVGYKFAKISWCHKKFYAPLLVAVKNSTKKSNQRLTF